MVKRTTSWLAMIWLSVVPVGIAEAQVATGWGPGVLGSSIDQTAWHANPVLTSNVRLDAPLGSLALDGAMERDASGNALGTGSLGARIASPMFGPLRLVATAMSASQTPVANLGVDRGLAANLAYHSRIADAWTGFSWTDGGTSSGTAGVSRQMGSLSVSLAWAIRSARFGGRAPSRE